jgi:hypothetical protein
MTDTRERFLREIAERIPTDRIAELHLFRPMRRGATETGVAVIAALPPDALTPELAEPEGTVRSEAVEAVGASAEAADPAIPEAESTERTAVHEGEEIADIRTTPIVESVARIPIVVDETAETVELPTSDDSPYAEDYAAAYGLIETPASSAVPPASMQRHTVFTARYRMTLKGAERGKWEFDIVADADAPLVTVDTVVRGVQRRAGEDEEPERLTADGLRAALDGQSWRTAT